jgi:N utilization substance protein B
MQRKLARENAFLLIFESICKSDEDKQEIFEKAVEVRGLEYDAYVKAVYFGVSEKLSEICALTEKHFKGWKAERISPVSHAIIRLSTYEMMCMEDIPARVSINEAIELAKKYDDEKSYSFVNGVLNAVAEELGRK